MTPAFKQYTIIISEGYHHNVSVPSPMFFVYVPFSEANMGVASYPECFVIVYVMGCTVFPILCNSSGIRHTQEPIKINTDLSHLMSSVKA